MDTNRTFPPDASSTDAAVFPFTPAEPPARSGPATLPARIGLIEGHMPDLVDPLVPRHPENSFTETRRLRHDGWTPEKKRLFLERFAECGVIVEACEAAGMSARAAYNLRDRDPLFAAGWEAAAVKARAPLADEAYSRARNGVVERIYKDGAIVAERHRYDNRLTMAVLARLDARIDRAEERGAPHLAVAARWDDYLAALGEDRREDGMALLAPPAAASRSEAGAAGLRRQAGDRELRELYEDETDEEDEEEDRHHVWGEEDGWWTDYPPPAGFDGEEEGDYGAYGYRRTLTADEQAVIDAEEAEDKAEARALGEAQRIAYFCGVEPEQDAGPPPAAEGAEPPRPDRGDAHAEEP